MTAGPVRPREATERELADWDHRAVRSPGGHVYQSTVWASQRARLGWQPRFVMIDDEHPALVLQRPFPIVGGSSAYIPRGPVVDPNRLTDGGEAAADRVNALANWLVDAGVAVVAGEAYGLSPYFRLSIATSIETLDEGVARIARAVAELR